MELALSIIVGINTLTLVAVLTNTYRIGSLTGRMKNGDFVKCPYYKHSGNSSDCSDYDSEGVKNAKR